MHRLERGVLEREWRPYLLLESRIAGLARIRGQLEVVDELRAHAEQTGDRRQLDQAINDLADTWFFYQRLVATTESMPGRGLTPEKLAEERKKVPLDLGQPPKSPGELRPGMADALVASTELTMGRAYYGPDRADSLAAAQAAPPREKYYTVHVAATRNGVVIDGVHYSIREFATILRHDPAWHREPIRVTDDRTGLSWVWRSSATTPTSAISPRTAPPPPRARRSSPTATTTCSPRRAPAPSGPGSTPSTSGTTSTARTSATSS
jgi:hypothetical protein